MRKLATLMVMLVLSISQVMAQNSRTITGKVTDEMGTPIPSASVVVKGTTLGTTTDKEGSFSLKVPETAKTLVFSSVNFAAREVSIGKSSTVNVNLPPETSN
jgi:hypothetical protein